MNVRLTWKDWIIPLSIILICFVFLPFGLKEYSVWQNEQFKKDVETFAPTIMNQSRTSFDPALRVIATTDYQPIRPGEEWYGPRDETVQKTQTACKTLIEAASAANKKYYADYCGLFFKKDDEWIMVNLDVYKPKSSEFFMENILKLKNSTDAWRIDSFNDGYKLSYRLQTNPDAFVDIMITRRREY